MMKLQFFGSADKTAFSRIYPVRLSPVLIEM